MYILNICQFQFNVEGHLKVRLTVLTYLPECCVTVPINVYSKAHVLNMTEECPKNCIDIVK